MPDVSRACTLCETLRIWEGDETQVGTNLNFGSGHSAVRVEHGFDQQRSPLAEGTPLSAESTERTLSGTKRGAVRPDPWLQRERTTCVHKPPELYPQSMVSCG